MLQEQSIVWPAWECGALSDCVTFSCLAEERRPPSTGAAFASDVSYDQQQIREGKVALGFHRELLTFPGKAASLAGLHDSTPLGDHRSTLIGLPVAAGPDA